MDFNKALKIIVNTPIRSLFTNGDLTNIGFILDEKYEDDSRKKEVYKCKPSNIETYSVTVSNSYTKLSAKTKNWDYKGCFVMLHIGSKCIELSKIKDIGKLEAFISVLKEVV